VEPGRGAEGERRGGLGRAGGEGGPVLTVEAHGQNVGTAPPPRIGGIADPT